MRHTTANCWTGLLVRNSAGLGEEVVFFSSRFAASLGGFSIEVHSLRVCDFLSGMRINRLPY